MCMIDGVDLVTPLSEGWRKARKAHKCSECRRDIQTGERYYSHRHIFEGAFHNHKFCEHCNVVKQWLMDECGGYIFHGIEEDIREHVEGYPMDVRRLAVGMKWDWKTPTGKLLPVPTVPATTHERMTAARNGLTVGDGGANG